MTYVRWTDLLALALMLLAGAFAATARAETVLVALLYLAVGLVLGALGLLIGLCVLTPRR